MLSANWGESDWGDFAWWGSPGRGVFGYPATSPTEFLALRILRPYHTPVRKMQPEDRSNGGDLYVYNKGITEYTFVLSARLTRSEKESLKVFFDTLADGKANQIFYADPEGTEHIVRIMNDNFDFPEESWNKFTGSLTLRKEG